MGWFSKKKEEKVEEIPGLPPLPSSNEELSFPSLKELPNLPTEDQDYPKSLPLLSNSDQQDELNEETIKNALSHSSTPYETNLKPLRTKERSAPEIIKSPSNKVKEPIYVRLDKFDVTLQAFEEIKEKIKQIEEYLLKTKEIKEQEEKELEEWEKEIQIIKSKIDSVDKTIFNKFD